jgi:hypothetical protein
VCTGYDSATGQSTDFPSGQTVYVIFSTYFTTATLVAQVSMLRSGNLEDVSLPVPSPRVVMSTSRRPLSGRHKPSQPASATTAQPQPRTGLPGGLRSGGEGGTGDTRSGGIRI